MNVDMPLVVRVRVHVEEPVLGLLEDERERIEDVVGAEPDVLRSLGLDLRPELAEPPNERVRAVSPDDEIGLRQLRRPRRRTRAPRRAARQRSLQDLEQPLARDRRERMAARAQLAAAVADVDTVPARERVRDLQVRLRIGVAQRAERLLAEDDAPAERRIRRVPFGHPNVDRRIGPPEQDRRDRARPARRRRSRPSRDRLREPAQLREVGDGREQDELVAARLLVAADEVLDGPRAREVLRRNPLRERAGEGVVVPQVLGSAAGVAEAEVALAPEARLPRATEIRPCGLGPRGGRGECPRRARRRVRSRPRSAPSARRPARSSRRPGARCPSRAGPIRSPSTPPRMYASCSASFLPRPRGSTPAAS